MTIAYALLALSALIGLFAQNVWPRRLGNAFACAGSVAALATALGSTVVPGLESHLRVAAIVAVGIASSLASLHALTYASHWDGRRRAAVMGVAFPVFVAAMLAVLGSRDLIEFLIAWEVMTVASAVLVVIDHEEPEHRSAVVLYLGVAHISPAAFLLAVGVLGPQSLDWTAIARAAGDAAPAVRSVSLALVLLGAAAKAGLFPLHSWLPRAHPAAPSYVSAVMSGSMVVLGAWALVRIGTDLQGMTPMWWGWVVAALGSSSALIGALYALVEGDLKRLLAYSTVENMGLLFMELGVCMAATAADAPAVAALALGAATVHVIAHAAAKSTLFLAAGSMINAAGTRIINRMGGLLRALPAIGIGFLLAAGSVTALPPLAGFVGEWLLARSLMGAASQTSGTLAILVAVALGVVALTAGLAVAALTKAAGIALLGTARHESAHRHPVGAAEKIAVLLGAAIVFALPFVLATSGNSPLASPDVHAISLQTVVIALSLLTAAAALTLLTKGKAMRVRRTTAWTCGTSNPTARSQYTADSFSQPLARVFAGVLNPSISADIDHHPLVPHAVRSRSYSRSSAPLRADAMGGQFMLAVRFVSVRVRSLQSGRLCVYAGWTLAATVFLLLYAGWVR